MFTDKDTLYHRLSKKDREILDLKSLVTQLDLTREQLTSKLLNHQLTDKKKSKVLREEMFERDEQCKRYHSELLRNEKLLKINDSLQTERNTLLLSMNEKDNHIQELNQRIKNLESSNIQLEEGVISIRKTFENQIDQKGLSLEFIENENKNLRKKIGKIQTDVNLLTEENEDCKTKNNNLLSENSKFKEQVKFSRKTVERLDTENSKLKNENDSYYRQISELKVEINSLRESFLKTNSKKDKFENDKKKVDLKYKQLVQDYKSVCFEKESNEKELLRITRKYKRYKEETDKKVGGLEDKFNEIHSQSREKVSEIAALKEDNKNLFQDNKTLTKELSKLRNDVKYLSQKKKETFADYEIYRKEVDILKKKLVESQNFNQNLELDLQNEKIKRMTMKKEMGKKQLQDSFSMSKKEEDYKNEINSLKKKIRDITKNERDLEQQLEKNLKKNLQLNEKIRQYESVNLMNEKLNEKNETYENKIEVLLKELEYQSKKSQSVKKVADQRIEEHQNTINRANYLEGEVKKLHKELKKKEKEIIQAKEANLIIKKRDDALTFQLRNIREELHSIKDKTEEVRSDNSKLKDLVKKLDSDRVQLMEGEVRLKKELYRVKSLSNLD